MSKVSINQPTYLPWAGYFNLIASADQFVFLDNVQFERSSWQNRNRILQQGKEILLTLPVQNASLEALIKDIKVSFSKNWQKRHIETIRQSYAKAPFKHEIFDLLFPLLEKRNDFLVDYTQPIILDIISALKINTPIHFSSELAIEGDRSDRLLGMCRSLSAQCYLSPIGARRYLEEDGVFSQANIALEYQQYVPTDYCQVGVTRFVSHLSIVDVIAHLGLEVAREYVLGAEMNDVSDHE